MMKVVMVMVMVMVTVTVTVMSSRRKRATDGVIARNHDRHIYISRKGRAGGDGGGGGGDKQELVGRLGS
jgi:hypothetical protein